MIGLYKISTTSIIDAYGVFGSNSWSNSLGVGDDGVNYGRSVGRKTFKTVHISKRRHKKHKCN